MNDKQIDELINQALREEQALPEGLSERLEQYIDTLADREEETKKRSLFSRRSFYLVGSVAAAMLIGLALFFQTEMNPKPTMADTFSDPEEAALVAQQALAFMSTQLNKGLAPVADAGKEINKVNEILNKQFNE